MTTSLQVRSDANVELFPFIVILQIVPIGAVQYAVIMAVCAGVGKRRQSVKRHGTVGWLVRLIRPLFGVPARDGISPATISSASYPGALENKPGALETRMLARQGMYFLEEATSADRDPLSKHAMYL